MNGNQLNLGGGVFFLGGGDFRFDDANTGITQSGLDMQFDIAVGGSQIRRINGIIEYAYDASQADFKNNNIIGVEDIQINAAAQINFDGATGETNMAEVAADDFLFTVGAQNGLRLREVSTEVSVVCGANNALATNAIHGFLFIPSMAGAPTLAPSGFTGKVAFVYDTVGNELYVYNGAWRSIALA